jgi:hypothetical protein
VELQGLESGIRRGFTPAQSDPIPRRSLG